MKLTLALVAVAGTAMAQQLSDLPQCGQTCISNMIGIATKDFGCKAGDIHCYCTNQDFGYGIRDCSNQACSAEDAAKVIAFGTNYCQQAVSAASTGAVPVLTSALSDASSVQSVVASATDSAGSVITSVASSANSVASSASDAASSVANSASDALSSAASSASDAASSAASSASNVASSAASRASSATSAATGGAPMRTAFPMAGAAGMAALFFI